MPEQREKIGRARFEVPCYGILAKMARHDLSDWPLYRWPLAAEKLLMRRPYAVAVLWLTNLLRCAIIWSCLAAGLPLACENKVNNKERLNEQDGDCCGSGRCVYAGWL